MPGKLFVFRMPPEMEEAYEASGRTMTELGITSVGKELGMIDADGELTVSPRQRGRQRKAIAPPPPVKRARKRA